MQIKCLTPKECGMKLKEPVYEKCFNCSSFKCEDKNICIESLPTLTKENYIAPKYNPNSKDIPNSFFEKTQGNIFDDNDLKLDLLGETKPNNLADRKNDGKLRWHNFPKFLFRGVAKVAHFGEGKYETYNFLKGGPISQYLDSHDRHMDSFEDPLQSDLDQESGVNHLYHAAWNLLVAAYMLEHRPELDDRFKINK